MANKPQLTPVLSFDGQTHFVTTGELDSAFSFSSDFYGMALEARVFLPEPVNDWIAIANQWGSNGGYALAINPGSQKIRWKTSDNDICEGGPIPLNGWVHIIASASEPGPAWAGGGLSLYCNGERVAQANEASLTATSGPLQVGKPVDGQSERYFIGKLAELYLWDFSIPPEMVQDTYEKRSHLSARTTSLCWPLTEGTGTVANDFSQNNRHGTIHGASWETVTDFPLMPFAEHEAKLILRTV